MSKRLIKEKVIKMRMQGMSYSQIREKVHVSKSTLSNWLYSRPLSEEKIRQLRDLNPKRIERCRNTKRLKREIRLKEAYDWIGSKIGDLSKKEFLISGLFLYWGEGGKTKTSATSLTNTNPKMLIFFIRWLELFGIQKDRLRITLHLYADMDVSKQEKYWSDTLNIPLIQFRKSHIKHSLSSGLTYSNGFGQGTCTVSVDNTELTSKVLMGIKYIQDHL
jgi:hypothetical protein